MQNALDLTPEQRKLNQEFDQLKKKYASLMLTLEEMRQHDGPKLTALYLSLLGNKKYEILNLQVEIKTLEMRKQLLQSYINRDETPDLHAINKRVEDVVADYNRVLEQEAQRIKSAKEYLEAPLLSDEDSAEIRTLYRMLVKHLHPDLNPKLTENEKDLFQIVQEAYSSSNLDKLREISLAIDTARVVDSSNYTSDIQEYIDSLKGRIANLEHKIEELKNMFPHTLKDKIFDSKWVETEQKQCADDIAQLTEKRDNLRRIIEVMEEYKSQRL